MFLWPWLIPVLFNTASLRGGLCGHHLRWIHRSLNRIHTESPTLEPSGEHNQHLHMPPAFDHARLGRTKNCEGVLLWQHGFIRNMMVVLGTRENMAYRMAEVVYWFLAPALCCLLNEVVSSCLAAH